MTDNPVQLAAFLIFEGSVLLLFFSVVSRVVRLERKVRALEAREVADD